MCFDVTGAKQGIDLVRRRCQTDNRLTVEACRKLLGRSGEGLTDEQIERLRDGLLRVATIFFDDIADRSADELLWNSVLWSATDEEWAEFEREDARGAPA